LTHRVVVTGLGLVTPVGTDVDSTWQALLAGRSGAAPITKFDAANQQVRFACEVKGFDPLQYIDKKEARRYDLFAQLAIAAAHQAITQAGLEGQFPSPERTGVVIGTGIGGMQTYEDNCSLYLTKGPDRVSPFFVPMFIPDIAAGLVSIRYGLKGPNFATVSACASSAHAIGDSFNMIRHGTADAMVTGGSEAAITGRHPDNVAPSLYGGIVLVRSLDPPDLVELPVPPDLRVVLVHPDQRLRTRDARAVLPKTVPLETALYQAAQVAAMVAGLAATDYELLGRALDDRIAEPARASLLPGFAAGKQAALQAGALGASISGSGPTAFALARGEESAQAVAAAMQVAYADAGINARVRVAQVDQLGGRIVS